MPRFRIQLPHLLAVPLLFCGCTDEYEPIGPIDPDVPFPVTDLAISVTPDTTLLTWTATGDDGLNGTAERYDLRSHPTLLTPDNWADAAPVDGVPSPGPAGTREKFVLASGGKPASTVYLALKVIDDQGNASKLSNVVFADLEPPAAVTDLAAVRVTDSYARLSWTAPDDDGPLGHAARYEIRVDTEEPTEENWTDVAPRGGPSHPAEAGGAELFNLVNLEPLTRYHAAVRSRDEAGNLSGISNVVEFETPARPPGWWDGFADLQIDEAVLGLHVHRDTLFVGGRFTGVEGVGSRGIISYDGTAWHGCGYGVAAGQVGTAVLTMESYGNDLYLAGSFTYAGGVTCNNIARWTGMGFESLGNPLSKGLPFALRTFQDELYISWGYGPTSSAPFEFLNLWDGSSFRSLGWKGESGPFITAMALYEGRLAIVGDLKGVAGLTTESVILWDGGGYSAVGPDLAGGRFGDPYPASVCVYEGDLYVGGDFSHAGDLPVDNIARWDGSAWHSLAGGLGGEDIQVTAMIVYGGTLVVTGHFATAGGQVVNNIARWDGSYWESFGSGLEGEGLPWVTGAALAVYQGSLYVGGYFETVDGNPSPYLARWDLD